MRKRFTFISFLILIQSIQAEVVTIQLPEKAVISGALISQGQIEYFQHGQEKVDELTLFEVGSVTKVFTALAAAHVAIENPSFETVPIAEFIPDITNPAVRNLTVNQLITHTSGLARLPPSFNILHLLLNSKDPYRSYSREQLIKDLQRDQPTSTKGKYIYSNYGYAILGILLERTTERPYTTIIEEDIFLPLGMKHSLVQYTEENEKSLIAGLGKDAEETSIWHHDASAPIGSIVSNAHDLALFLKRFLNPGEDTLGQAMKWTLVSQKDINNRRAISRGWLIDKSKQGMIYWHNGATGGFRSFIAFSPDHNCAVLLLCNYAGVENLDQNGIERLIQHIAEINRTNESK